MRKIADLQSKVANLTPEDYRGERKIPSEIQKKIEFRRKLRKEQKPGDPKFKII